MVLSPNSVTLRSKHHTSGLLSGSCGVSELFQKQRPKRRIRKYKTGSFPSLFDLIRRIHCSQWSQRSGEIGGLIGAKASIKLILTSANSKYFSVVALQLLVSSVMQQCTTIVFDAERGGSPQQGLVIQAIRSLETSNGLNYQTCIYACLAIQVSGAELQMHHYTFGGACRIRIDKNR